MTRIRRAPRQGENIRVFLPSRFVDRHVGGNTTYAQAISRGLTDRGIATGAIPAGPHPAITALLETATGLRAGSGGDVLHYTGDTGPFLGTRRPTVVTVHGVASRWISVARRPRQEKAWRTRVQRAIDAADEVITVSNSSARDIESEFDVDPARITTIEHGIEHHRFTTPTPLSEHLRSLLPARFALYLGNIEPRKNLVPLIEAFSLPEVRDLDLPLVIAGKPAWNAEESLRAIHGSDSVISLGFVSDEDRTALMQACEVFVFPSLYEGFGFPVLEALSAGAVVLTSNRGSLEEVAGPSMLLRSLDTEGIADGLVHAVHDAAARKRCLAEGPAWSARYTWGASIDKHVETYERVLSR